MDKNFEELEQKRQEACAYYNEYRKKAITWGLLFFTLIGIFVCIYYVDKYSKAKNAFLNDYKIQLVQTLAPETLSKVKYSPVNGLYKSVVNKACMFAKPDAYSSSNYHGATYKNVSYMLSDAVLQQRNVTRTKHGTIITYTTYFNGKFIQINLNRNFNGVVRCVEKGMLATRTVNTGYKTQKVQLESMAFNKKFTTTASSKHDTFFILTPPVQEKLMLLEKKIRGHFYFQILDNKMYIAVNNSAEMFFVKPEETLTESKVKPIRELLDLVPSIIDAIGLDSPKYQESEFNFNIK